MCTQCLREKATFFFSLSFMMPECRAVTLYHEGFTVPQISEIIKYDPLTVAYWIEEYA